MFKVLVADDDRQILDSIVDVFENGGYEVVGVCDGLQALALLKTHSFDMAIIDVMMPKMDGYHLAAKIHALEKKPKVVIMSSRRFEEDKVTLDHIGVSAFMQKPFSIKELLETVQRLLKLPV
jgi:two-component system, OmpR family, response regulator ResD